MKPVEIKKDIHWIGSVDWVSRNFHGYSTSPDGTTYNAFVVKDEKNVILDTVKKEAASEMLCRLAHVVKPEEVDYIVVNHVEMDHSGALPELIERCKPEKVFCSPLGERAIKAHFNSEGWPLVVTPTGTVVNIGKRNLHFVETRMVHWPDNMVTYIPEDKLLISSDAFGQNIASNERFADKYDRAELYRQTLRYFANIVLPYSTYVDKTFEVLQGLDIDMIAPDHGLIWRNEDVAYVLKAYREFCAQKPAKKAVIVYDTMWHSTEKMAKAIAGGLDEEGISVRIMSLKHNHHSDVMQEVMDAGAVIVGSPTHNNGILPLVSCMLTYMKGLRPLNKIGAAFGSFGWSGESVKIISEALKGMHMELPFDPVKAQYVPKHEAMAKCRELGQNIGKAINAKCS